jgi:broad specificity phosphatase PhoE
VATPPDIPRLILVKHALPVVDPTRPAREWTLSREGEAACGPLADLLRPYAPTSVTASPEPKATETGRRLAEALEVSFDVLAGLHEHDRSDLGFLPWSEVEAGIERLFAESGSRVFGKETADEAHERFAAAVASVLARDAARPVIVAHGTVISLYVARAAGIDAFELWQGLGTPAFVALSSTGAVQAREHSARSEPERGEPPAIPDLPSF